jgi:hypothetical protein
VKKVLAGTDMRQSSTKILAVILIWFGLALVILVLNFFLNLPAEEWSNLGHLLQANWNLVVVAIIGVTQIIIGLFDLLKKPQVIVEVEK